MSPEPGSGDRDDALTDEVREALEVVFAALTFDEAIEQPPPRGQQRGS